MVETLAGTIDKTSLLEILKLLHSGMMTGRLQLGNNYHKGELFVNAGQIIHCVAGDVMGEAALSSIIGWIESNFSFESDIESPETSIQTPTPELLRECAEKLKDWQNIKKVFNSLEIILGLSQRSSTEKINLELEEWQTLAYVNGSRNITEIVELTGKDEFSIAKILHQLHSKGLVEKIDKPVKPAAAVINEAFFKKIEEELTKAIGPMATILIEEAIIDLGETRSAFPNEKIAVLVEKVSNEIADSNKMLQFSKTMIESLKNL
jgi:DNA-binding MarR family transcriptional regulator